MSDAAQDQRGWAACYPWCANPGQHPGSCIRPDGSPALSDEERTVLEVYSRTHTGLVPDAIQAILASHDGMLGTLEGIAEREWRDEGGRIAAALARDGIAS